MTSPGRNVKPEKNTRFILNGRALERPGQCALDFLMRDLNIKPERAVTIINGDIVKPDMRSAREVRDGDRVEIVTLAGGG